MIKNLIIKPYNGHEMNVENPNGIGNEHMGITNQIEIASQANILQA